MTRESDTLALLGHELRTPVASIKAAATALRTRGSSLDPPTHERLVALIDDQAGLLARLLDDVLAAARLDGGRLAVAPRPCDAAAIARDVAEAARARASDRAVRYEGPAAAHVLADPDRLAQVLGNLVENGLRHGAGTVTVSCAATPERVSVAVSDEGAGIPAADRERIFARYERADTRSSGTGLGLWLARELAERMGGSLELADTAGGTSFVLTLRTG